DFGLLAKSCFFESQIQVRTRISAFVCTIASAGIDVDSKEIAEKIAKDVAEICERGRIKATESAIAHTSMTKLIVTGALLTIDEHAVRFAGFLELLFRLRIVGIAVRVILHRQLAVRALDLLIAGAAFYAQNFVIIAFCLCSQIEPLRQKQIRSKTMPRIVSAKSQTTSRACQLQRSARSCMVISKIIAYFLLPAPSPVAAACL